MTPAARRVLIASAGITGTLVAGLSGAVPQAQAQNYPWCAEYSMGVGGGPNCGFISFEQCMTTVRDMGAFCVENNTHVPPPGSHPRAKRKQHGAKSS